MKVTQESGREWRETAQKRCNPERLEDQGPGIMLDTLRMASGFRDPICKMRSLDWGSGFPDVFLGALGSHGGAPAALGGCWAMHSHQSPPDKRWLSSSVLEDGLCSQDSHGTGKHAELSPLTSC